jgi:hypothetical protein
VAYRCAKTLVFTSSDMKSTDKRIVCQGEYQRILKLWTYFRLSRFTDYYRIEGQSDDYLPRATVHRSSQGNYRLWRSPTRQDGDGSKTVFGRSMVFDLRNSIPILTTKRVFVRGVIEELLWFVSGSSDATVLGRKNVKIWEHHRVSSWTILG